MTNSCWRSLCIVLVIGLNLQLLTTPEQVLGSNNIIGETASKRIQTPIGSSPAKINRHLYLLHKLQEISFSPWDLVLAVDWAPDGRYLAVSAGDAIHIYDVDGWREISKLAVGALSHGLAFSPDGRWLATGSRDGFLRLWKLSARIQPVHLLPPQKILAHRKGVNRLVYSLKTGILATGGNDAISRLWNPEGGELLGMAIGGSFSVPSIDFSPDGTVLAVVNGHLIRLRELNSERILGTFLADAPLFHVQISPDGNRIAASGSDNLIRIWEINMAFKTGQTKYPEPLLLVGHQGEPGSFRALIWELDYSTTGELLASAGGDTTIRLWDPVSGALLGTYPAHPGGATCVSFSPDGKMIASGGLDGKLIIWSVDY